ncbi:MAG: hypothetical protein D6718_03135 [Acidobacteria bacterium]|nr:MAG: hypothetical protein D6718_03135 [Acidobacteriota bacterium]
MPSLRPSPRFSVAAILVALLASGLAAAQERWLHVRIVDASDDATDVKINLPLETVRALLPAFQEAVREAYREVRSDLAEQGVDLEAIRQALQNVPDGEFVTIQSAGENVRIAKEKGFLVVRVNEADKERVDLKVPTRVFEVLVAAGDDESVDLAAALDALAETTGQDLVQVTDGESRIRIWIDEKETAD